MTSSPVYGKDMVLYVFNSGIFIPIACSRNCVFTSTTDVAGKSTIGSGIWKEFKAIVNGGTLSADGIVRFDTNLSVASLRAYQFNLSSVNFQFKSVDESGNGVLYEGLMIITSITETGNYNDLATYSMQAVISGQVTITSTIGNPGIIFYNTQDNNADPVDFTQFIEGNPDNDIIIHYGHLDTALFYWMAHSISAAQKTDWEDENEPGNAGEIGADTDLFEVRLITINGADYILYITRYVTFFNGFNAVVKYFRIPGGCLPPTAFAITNIVNDGSDTGSITQTFIGGNTQVLQIGGVPSVGGTFTLSIYGQLFSITVDVDTPNDIIAASFTTQINNRAIPVPGGSQPPSVVTAFHTIGSNSFTIQSGTPPVVIYNYLPASMATVTFNWAEPSPVGITYTIRITNTDLSTTIYNVGGVPTRDINLRRGYNYNFAIRTNCTNGSSDFTADLTQFIP